MEIVNGAIWKRQREYTLRNSSLIIVLFSTFRFQRESHSLSFPLSRLMMSRTHQHFAERYGWKKALGGERMWCVYDIPHAMHECFARALPRERLHNWDEYMVAFFRLGDVHCNTPHAKPRQLYATSTVFSVVHVHPFCTCMVSLGFMHTTRGRWTICCKVLWMSFMFDCSASIVNDCE